MQISSERYTSVAIILHWIMAIAILLMLISGFSMENLELAQNFKFKLFQWHKSLGVLVLITVIVRLLWRITHKPPQLPASFKKFELFAAHAGHWLLYVCMFAMPISGWVMVSASIYGLPTIVFGLFQWPHIPNLTGNEAVKELAEEFHTYTAFFLSFLIAGHVFAVIKHAVIDKENILFRMWWKKKNDQRGN